MAGWRPSQKDARRGVEEVDVVGMRMERSVMERVVEVAGEIVEGRFVCTLGLMSGWHLLRSSGYNNQLCTLATPGFVESFDRICHGMRRSWI